MTAYQGMQKGSDSNCWPSQALHGGSRLEDKGKRREFERAWNWEGCLGEAVIGGKVQKKPGKRDFLRGQLRRMWERGRGGGEANGWLGRGALVEKGTHNLSTGYCIQTDYRYCSYKMLSFASNM